MIPGTSRNTARLAGPATATGSPQRRRAGRGLALAALLVMLVCAMLAPLVPQGSLAAGQWRIETADGAALMPNRPFSLYNLKDKEYVRYGSREYGINLVWSKSPSKSFTVARKSGSGSIKYGELVALRETNSSGGYIYYGHRTWGINLNWSDSPVYEWKITGGPTGTAVNNKAAVTLYNTAAPKPNVLPWCASKGSAVVYGWRPFGINLVWDPPGFYYRDLPSLGTLC